MARKPRPTKFIKGGRLWTLADLIEIHRSQRPWVYWRGVPKHTSWIMNMSVGVVHRLITLGYTSEALPNPAYKEKSNAFPF